MSAKDKDYILRYNERKFPVSIFKGRISRSQFIFSLIIFSVISYILGLGINYVQNYFNFQLFQGANTSLWSFPLLIGYGELLIIALLTIATIILFISVFSKRFHDIGKSGYWGLLCIIPYLGVFVVIFLIFRKGANGINKYGNSPSTFFI
jgi:uncharacterized membrane protein YhaH (DUF805 family)